VARDDFSVQAQLGDHYVPPPMMDYPAGAQGEVFNRVERAVARWPDRLAGVAWEPATQRIVIKSTPAGMKRAAEIAARLATEGIAEAIVVEQVRFSETELHALHMRVVEDNYGWLGQHMVSVTGSEGDVRINAVIVDLEVPLSEEALEITRARWGSDVRLRFSPGSRMIEQ
jgi:hypothetical protein